MRSRVENLECALLGLLAKGPLHGYELRKRMIALVGPFRALSFSVLYPQLRRMLNEGFIKETTVESRSKRPRIVYAITTSGIDRFTSLAESVSSEAWDDEGFEIRFAFFEPTPSKSRLRVLEGRLQRLQEKADMLRQEVERSSVGIDKYLREWRIHSLESAEREIKWLQDLITNERKSK